VQLTEDTLAFFTQEEIEFLGSFQPFSVGKFIKNEYFIKFTP